MRQISALICLTGTIAVVLVARASGADEDASYLDILARVNIFRAADKIGSPISRQGDVATDRLSDKGSAEEPAAVPSPTELQASRQARFTEWVRYEDEFVSFSFQRMCGSALEIKSPGDPIPIFGSPVSSSENEFFRCYRLTFNGATYCLLLLDRTNDFDDGVCFCGHVAAERYLEHHGSLYRFSLFGNGLVKKIQMLGDGLRLVLFEWTHMPISQQVYAQIALSVRFRQPPRNLQALTDRIQQVYGKARISRERHEPLRSAGTAWTADKRGTRSSAVRVSASA